MNRSAGVLMPIFSLPSPYGIGTMGQAARDFTEFLHAGGQSYWQVLPAGPTSYGDSPYQSFSSFAGNPYFIDLDDLAADGLLEPSEYRMLDWGQDEGRVDYALLYQTRFPVLRLAVKRLLAAPNAEYGVISRDNREILFTQGSLNMQNAVDGKIGDFCVSEELYSLYNDDDARKELFFNRVLSTDALSIEGKYLHTTHQSYVSDLYMLRTSEAYLNMAEACAMAGDQAEAHRWLNDFRRYRIRDYQDASYDEDTLVEEIRNERRKEFCIEGGHRWFDLRRYAVNRQYPDTKVIERIFAVYNSQNQIIHTEIFQLEEHDAAYTFMLPKSVTEFDPEMPNNTPRPVRDPIEIINPSKK